MTMTKIGLKSQPPFFLAGASPFLRRFSYKEIKRATDGFSRIIGSDSGGAAYKAQFPDGLVGVVKKVRVLESESAAFHRDLQLLARLHHRHLVSLRGFSEEHDRSPFPPFKLPFFGISLSSSWSSSSQALTSVSGSSCSTTWSTEA